MNEPDIISTFSAFALPSERFNEPIKILATAEGLELDYTDWRKRLIPWDVILAAHRRHCPPALPQFPRSVNVHTREDVAP